MRYLSVCSGIEAATVAWHGLGWEPAAFAEVDKFPSAVLAHHYPDVPNVGDFTAIKGDEFGTIDLLVGGTPCQSFSTAGLRRGLDDARGNLTVEFLRLAGRMLPRWVVWENVPGVLSIDGGRTFGTILGTLAELGYGFAHRILDAQYFGVPQRRRRVFVVGYLGDWRLAAAVLFERHCLSGHTAPRRKTGQEITGTVTSRAGKNGGSANGDIDGGLTIAASHWEGGAHPCLGQSAKGSGGIGMSNQEIFSQRGAGLTAAQLSPTVCAGPPFSRTGNDRVECEALVVHAVTTKNYRLDAESETFAIANTLRGEGFDGSEDGTGRANLIPINLQIAIASHVRASHVRRLTPRECERLQGFEDDYTLIPWRGKPAEDCPDGPRYKAIGNSMAVNVMTWIGRRIDAVDSILRR